MNVLEKLSELTTMTGNLTDELLKVRSSKTVQQDFRFSFSEPTIDLELPFRLTLSRPIFIGIRNLIFRKTTGGSGAGQSIKVRYQLGNDIVTIDINSVGGLNMPNLIDLSQFPTYIFPREDTLGREETVSLSIEHNLTANNYSLLSQGDASFFVTYI